MFLKNPRFGNSFKLDTGIIVHDLLDDDTQIFKPSDRPAVEGFTVSFEALTDAEKDRLILFFRSSAGELIDLTDHEGTDWQGMITDREIIFNEVGRTCAWETSFTFEGKRV